MLCRVTIINERGEIVVDTLVHQEDEDLEKIHYRRHVHIHGITSEMLRHAPKVGEVLKYLQQIIPDPEKVIFIGHSPKVDLRLLGFTSHNYIDT